MRSKIDIFWVAVLTLLLAACGGDRSAPESAAPAYQAAFFDAGLAHEEFLGSCAGTGGDPGLYLLTLHRDSEELDHGCLYRYTEELGLENILVTDEFLDGEPGYIRPEAVQPGGRGTLWLTVYGGTLEAGNYRYYLWQVDGEGNGGKRIDLTALMEKTEVDRLNGAFVEDSGWIYLVSGDTIHVFNEGLLHHFTLDARELLSKRPVGLSDGRLGFLAPAAEGGLRAPGADRGQGPPGLGEEL